MTTSVRKFILPIFILLLAVTPFLSAEAAAGTEVDAFRKNFTRGSLSTKVRILQDSIDYEGMTSLYLLSLDFIGANSWMLLSDNIGRELVFFTVRLIAAESVSDASAELWELFLQTDDLRLKVEIMSALGDTAEGDAVLAAKIEDWLEIENTKFSGGGTVEQRLVAEAASSLGRIGEPSSFPVVFTTASLAYSGDVTGSALLALGGIRGDYSGHLMEVVRTRPASEKLSALSAASSRNMLSREQQAAVALTALDSALSSGSTAADQDKDMQQLRFESVRLLSALGWTGGADILIRHFDLTIIEWEQKLCRKVELLEAVDALGSSGSHDAAVRLSLYLEVLNSYTENGRTVDEQVMMSLIRNLGILGDYSAFDYLLYTGYLDYSGSIKRAAREALKNLKNI